MANEFLVDFDTLLDQILTDYQNLDSNPDTSIGTMTYIKGACLSSMLWGLYRYQDYLARQIFPGTSDTENLNKHGSSLNIPRSSNDTDATYLTKILNKLRNPPAGGNKRDWENWAKQDGDGVQISTGPACLVNGGSQTGTTLIVDNMLSSVTSIEEDEQFYIEGDSQVYTLSTQANFVSQAATLEFTPAIVSSPDDNAVVRFVGTDYYTTTSLALTPNTDGVNVSAGSVEVVFIPNDETILSTPTATALKTLIEDNMEYLRPVTSNDFTVYEIDLQYETIIINVEEATETEITQMKEDIISYGDSLEPGEDLVKAKLISICIDNGATNATVISPLDDVSPTSYQAVRVSGEPTITEV